MMEMLKPCPVCGKMILKTSEFPFLEIFSVSCENTACRVHPFAVGKTMEESVTAWNTLKVES